MTDKIPAVLGSPLYDPKRKFVPGSSTDYSCMACRRTLVVSPSSLRHMERMRDQHEWIHLCPWCVDQIAKMAAERGDLGMHVAQVPGAQRDLLDAGLLEDAVDTADEAERLQRLFGTTEERP